MKKFVAIMLSAVLCAALALPVFAADADYTVNTAADNIVIDGKVDSGEWGEPVFTTTPDECFKKQTGRLELLVVCSRAGKPVV